MIELHMICWNESEILPFVLKHYKRFCQKMTIYDNYSTDNSREIAESMGCEVKLFGTEGELNDQHYLDIKNNCWKGSKADYVIVCDTDEVLTGIGVHGTVSSAKERMTIQRTQGWQIISNEMPKNEILEITNGWKFDNYSKAVMFDPQAIQEINYNPGAHKIAPVGKVVYSEDVVYLLHYRQIGGVERLIKRYAQYRKRLSNHNLKTGHGIHYRQTIDKIKAKWKTEMAKSTPLG